MSNLFDIAFGGLPKTPFIFNDSGPFVFSVPEFKNYHSKIEDGFWSATVYTPELDRESAAVAVENGQITLSFTEGKRSQTLRFSAKNLDISSMEVEYREPIFSLKASVLEEETVDGLIEIKGLTSTQPAIKPESDSE